MPFIQLGSQIFCTESILRVHINQPVKYTLFLTLKETPDNPIQIGSYDNREETTKVLSEIYRALGQVSNTSDVILT